MSVLLFLCLQDSKCKNLPWDLIYFFPSSEFDHSWIISVTGLASHIRFQRPDYSLSADRCTLSIPGCLNLGSIHLPHSEEFDWDLTCLQADEVQVTDFSSRVPSASLSLGGKTHIQVLPGTETSGTGHSVPFLAHLTSWSSTYAWEIPPHDLFPPGKKQ